MNPEQVAATLRGMDARTAAEFLENVGRQLMHGVAMQLATSDPNAKIDWLQELQASLAAHAEDGISCVLAVRGLEDLIRAGWPMLDAIFQLASEGMIAGADPDEGWGS